MIVSVSFGISTSHGAASARLACFYPSSRRRFEHKRK
jgi:hypothetical protein